MTFSKHRQKSNALKSIHARKVEIKGTHLVQMIYRYQTNDQTKNVSLSEFVDITEDILNHTFYNANLHIEAREYSFVSNKKNARITSRKTKTTTVKSTSHDHQKERLIAENAPFLQLLGISSSNGHVYQQAQKKYRQINKFIEILSVIMKGHDVRSIADMGCGKGYLSFATYSNFGNDGKLNLTGYDIRPELMNICNDYAEQLSMKGLQFKVGNIVDIELPATDMVIALHACDIATDMAIAKGVASSAKIIVVSPCCHKQVRKSMEDSDHLKSVLSHGIMKERLAEWLTDAIRVLLLEAQGYRTRIMEFISSEHTSKNLLITAVKGEPRPEAIAEVEALKQQYGIQEHYLETLLS